MKALDKADKLTMQALRMLLLEWQRRVTALELADTRDSETRYWLHVLVDDLAQAAARADALQRGRP